MLFGDFNSAILLFVDCALTKLHTNRHNIVIIVWYFIRIILLYFLLFIECKSINCWLNKKIWCNKNFIYWDYIYMLHHLNSFYYKVVTFCVVIILISGGGSDFLLQYESHIGWRLWLFTSIWKSYRTSVLTFYLEWKVTSGSKYWYYHDVKTKNLCPI